MVLKAKKEENHKDQKPTFQSLAMSRISSMKMNLPRNSTKPLEKKTLLSLSLETTTSNQSMTSRLSISMPQSMRTWNTLATWNLAMFKPTLCQWLSKVKTSKLKPRLAVESLLLSFSLLFRRSSLKRRMSPQPNAWSINPIPSSSNPLASWPSNCMNKEENWLMVSS